MRSSYAMCAGLCWFFFCEEEEKEYSLWAGKLAGLLLRPQVFVRVNLKALARA